MRPPRFIRIAGIVVAAIIAAGVLPSAQSLPAGTSPVAAGSIDVTIERAGRLADAVNPTSPAVAGEVLLLIDQAKRLLRWNGGEPAEILTLQQAPGGLKLTGNEAIVNAAATKDGRRVFVMFTSAALPRGVPERRSPRPGADAWHVLYEYGFDGTSLTKPRPIVALQMRSDGHTGGGMAVLADASILFATGDNGDAGEDGRTFAQDPRNHLGKILRIDPANGNVQVVALGVRNPQRLEVGLREGDVYVDFADMGGSVAEELNRIRLTDLLQAGRVNNFGWGRHADGRTREGKFYIDPSGAATGPVPQDEPGFVSPVAALGREGGKAFAVASAVSAPPETGVSLIAADLVSGTMFAFGDLHSQPSSKGSVVNLRDASGATSLSKIAAAERTEPRMFSFPDGTPGVLIERTGEFFRLKVPVPSASAAVRPLPRDGFFSSGDVRLHYVEHGTGDAVILLHELDGSAASFMRSGIFRDLAKDHRVIALDSRGHGQSDKPRVPAAYGTGLADDVVRLMDELKIPRAHIVGYSMGTEVAAMLLLRAPDRVRSVAFIAGAGRFRWLPTDDQHLEEEALEYENLGVSPKLFLEQTPAGTPDPEIEDLKRRAAVTLADPSRDTKALAALSRARRSRMVDQARLTAAATPMLGIAGSLDPELDALKTLKALRADLELVTVAGATHAGEGRVIDRSECLAALRTFLGRAANPVAGR